MEGHFIAKFQKTINYLILYVQKICLAFGEVSTKDLVFNGVEDRLKEEQEKNRKLMEENEKLQKSNSEKDGKIEDMEKKNKKNREMIEKLENISKKQEEEIKGQNIKISQIDALIAKEESKGIGGAILSIAGCALCCTGIGAIVGVPMIVGGAAMIDSSEKKIEEYRKLK